MVGELLRGVDDVVVGARLVADALAVLVHLEERLRCEREKREALVAPTVKLLVGQDNAAVEDHSRGEVVHVRAGPQHRLDALALGRSPVQVAREACFKTALARREHFFVVDVAARGHHDTLGGVDSDVAVRALGDGTHNGA